MKLSDLLKDLEYLSFQGNPETEISSVSCDSRQVTSGGLFAALPGALADGFQFIPSAVSRGAAAIVAERPADVPEGVAVIVVPDARIALARISAAFYGHPADRLTLIGITGTKGKTTTAFLIHSALQCAGIRVGMIGTIGTYIGTDLVYPALNTTPESLEIHRILAEMEQAGCTHVVMEISSQAMKLHRAEGILFDTALFLNLSPDHIGGAEHATFEEYRDCKARLFTQCHKAVGNLDDENWPYIRTFCHPGCAVSTFGLQPGADVRGSRLRPIRGSGLLGTEFQTEHLAQPCRVPLPGRFNVLNALAAIAACQALGIPVRSILEGLESVVVPGRTEIYPHQEGDYIVLIDYAHNDVSFQSLLTTLTSYDHHRIIVVFGAGGDRPRMRRTDMAREAAKYADFAVITADNPRTEPVEDICADITAGLEGKIPSVEIYDRREAIFFALDMAETGDIVALLGKGHEEYIEVHGKRTFFSEKEVLNEYFESKKS